MGVRKEIWARAIIEGLYAPNTFMSKAVNDDAFVYQGKKVHIPQAGTPPKVVKNRSTVPATAVKRDDTDIEYDINEYTTDPVLIPNVDEYELSYSKRESLIRESRSVLIDTVAKDMLVSWAPAAAQTIQTTGSAVDPHLNAATGQKKAVTRKDIQTLQIMFDWDNVPENDRYLLLDAYMYGQLLSDLTEADKNMFLSCADAKNGIVGELYGFKVMKRSLVLRYTAAKAVSNHASTTATDLAGGLAWQVNSVSRALGEIKPFTNVDDPQFYGTVLSFLVRTGGSKRRNDKKGIVALLEGTVAAG